MVLVAQNRAVWSYRADGEDVVSQIMWAFLLFIPPDQFTFTSTDLGLHMTITTIEIQGKPALLLCCIVGRAAESQRSMNYPPRRIDPH